MKMLPITAANHRRRIIRIMIRDHKRIVAGNDDTWLRFRFDFGRTGPQMRARRRWNYGAFLFGKRLWLLGIQGIATYAPDGSVVVLPRQGSLF
jgi:hypothetical protein